MQETTFDARNVDAVAMMNEEGCNLHVAWRLHNCKQQQELLDCET